MTFWSCGHVTNCCKLFGSFSRISPRSRFSGRNTLCPFHKLSNNRASHYAASFSAQNSSVEKHCGHGRSQAYRDFSCFACCCVVGCFKIASGKSYSAPNLFLRTWLVDGRWLLLFFITWYAPVSHMEKICIFSRAPCLCGWTSRGYTKRLTLRKCLILWWVESYFEEHLDNGLFSMSKVIYCSSIPQQQCSEWLAKVAVSCQLCLVICQIWNEELEWRLVTVVSLAENNPQTVSFLQPNLKLAAEVPRTFHARGNQGEELNCVLLFSKPSLDHKIISSARCLL